MGTIAKQHIDSKKVRTAFDRLMAGEEVPVSDIRKGRSRGYYKLFRDEMDALRARLAFYDLTTRLRVWHGEIYVTTRRLKAADIANSGEGVAQSG